MTVWLALACAMAGNSQETKPGVGGELSRWSKVKANEWYSKQPWRVGCNFIPSTAINQLEMWQADTFDPVTIDRELKWASELGFKDAGHLARQIASLKKQGRPVICTEWMRRGNSDVASCLPIFKKEGVGCCNWGLVAGKTQTIYPWGSPPGAPEPKVWFHDLLKKNGAPFNPLETAMFKELTKGRK